MERQVSGLCPGSQKTFCAVEVGNSGEKKISNFQCVVVVNEGLCKTGRPKDAQVSWCRC